MPRSTRTGLRDPAGWALVPRELEGTPSPLPLAQGSIEDMCKDGPCICTNQLAGMPPQHSRNPFPIPLRSLGQSWEEGDIPHRVSSWPVGSKVTHPSYICPQVSVLAGWHSVPASRTKPGAAPYSPLPKAVIFP